MTESGTAPHQNATIMGPSFRAAVSDGHPPAAAARTPTIAEIYEEHFAFVWRSARRLGTAAGHVDDVVQDTFMIAHRKLASFEGRSSMKTWLFGILQNVVRAHRRSAEARLWRSPAPGEIEETADAAANPDEDAGRAEAMRLVDHLLDGLDEAKRAVFVLAELEQMSMPEIAEALQIPLNTAYSRLRLARQEFRAAAARHRAQDARRMP